MKAATAVVSNLLEIASVRLSAADAACLRSKLTPADILARSCVTLCSPAFVASVISRGARMLEMPLNTP
jgi:hypothetical protein